MKCFPGTGTPFPKVIIMEKKKTVNCQDCGIELTTMISLSDKLCGRCKINHGNAARAKAATQTETWHQERQRLIEWGKTTERENIIRDLTGLLHKHPNAALSHIIQRIQDKTHDVPSS